MTHFNIDYSKVPGGIDGYMTGAVRRYIENGIPPGHFLTAVITNDLFEAFGRADDFNSSHMRGWVLFFYNYAPSGCYGSPQRMSEWMASRQDDARRTITEAAES